MRSKPQPCCALLEPTAALPDACHACAAVKNNQDMGSIYMVFEYMDHDLMGLMERRAPTKKFEEAHVRHTTPHQQLSLMRRMRCMHCHTSVH